MKLPDVGEGIAEAELSAWHVAVGDVVKEDDPLAEVMTDKAAVEIPSAVSGRVVWLGGAAGDTMAIGADLIRLEVEGEGNTSPDEAAASDAASAVKAPAPAAARPTEAPPAPRFDLKVADGKGLFEIKVPDVGEGIAEAELTGWSVSVGAQIKEDDIIAEVMTEKAAVEIPSNASGKVLYFGGSVGDTLAIGSTLILLEVDGAGNTTVEDVAKRLASTAPATAAAPAPSIPSKPVPKPRPEASAPRPAPKAATAPAGAQRRAEGERPLTTPSVRKRARELGVDLRRVMGSGPAGRITHEDLTHFHQTGGQVAASVAKRPQRSGETEERVIGLRRKIAERMALSKSRIPHITIVEEVDVTELEALRGQLNRARAETKGKLTILPFVIRAIVDAVAAQPNINAHFEDDAGMFRKFEAVHVGIATQTPGGLIVPVVRHCEAMSLWESAAELGRLASAARDGKVKADDLSGSTITITSLGALGALATTPIINYPEVAIVGINKIAVRPHWDGKGFVPRQKMNISCSFDHRVIDGWDAAVFVQKLKTLLETPALLMLED
ncbi:2-oxo acid dehydrogenase subunit E2 [Defluviimonas sp. WL0024]|uniref:Dihydrolipoamide acetyltransferase component of pyruvate dehydrogenase complex n=1 Tax=Albidovulum salinarum TaxID=2984153 RepID=A0ABT2X172_9RHOB|nr:2-oxo acid dehydrogenase subunit E2 [Defluviimonas sp. WL0024]MCU9846757.1 2-oxo acid dehydrogenase subunit E2 [Defluviimonas sp. WL0024]